MNLGTSEEISVSYVNVTESSIAPESIATFTFTLQKPQYSLGTKNEYFQLALEDGTKFNNFLVL